MEFGYGWGMAVGFSELKWALRTDASTVKLCVFPYISEAGRVKLQLIKELDEGHVGFAAMSKATTGGFGPTFHREIQTPPSRLNSRPPYQPPPHLQRRRHRTPTTTSSEPRRQTAHPIRADNIPEGGIRQLERAATRCRGRRTTTRARSGWTTRSSSSRRIPRPYVLVPSPSPPPPPSRAPTPSFLAPLYLPPSSPALQLPPPPRHQS